MSKENDQFLSLYRTYENLLRERGTDYRTEEEITNSEQMRDRMRMMRQMRNYLAHSEDPGFIAISPVCLKILQQMIKEEQLKGDIVKNHLVTPAKGSLKEGMPLAEAVYRLSILAMQGVCKMPVYDVDTKRLKGIITLEDAAYRLNKGCNNLDEEICGPYKKTFHLVKPDALVPEKPDDWYYCCTKDGTINSQYMGYLDI